MPDGRRGLRCLLSARPRCPSIPHTSCGPMLQSESNQMSPGLWLVAGDFGDVVPLADGSWTTEIHHSSCNSVLEGCHRHQPRQLLCWVAVLGLTDLTKALAGIEVGDRKCTPSDLHVHLGCHGSACMLFRSLSHRSKPQTRAVPDLTTAWLKSGHLQG